MKESLTHPDEWKQLLRRPNLHEDTSLHHAIRGGHKLVVELLIKEDPELCDITNAVHESPLYLAVHQRHSEIIDSILKVLPSPISYKGPKGLTALHAAVIRTTKRKLEIAHVTSPEVIKEGDDMGWTPLHYAACFGNVKAVKLFLQHNTSVAYVLDKEGASALHIAAFRGHVPIIDLLVTSCPDAWDIINTKEQTALHAAVIGRRANVVQHILRKPNLEDLINEKDTDGNTALHLAAVHKRYAIARRLALDKRVNRFATNKDHLTAFDIFFARNNTANRENSESMKSIFDSQLLVAVFIATVTFAATFTMPGGYNDDGPNQGMATLADKVAFKAFVIFNTIAFCFSTQALFLRYDTSFLSDQEKMEYAMSVGSSIQLAILGMLLAFASGTYVVLTRTSGLGIVPYVVIGILVVDYVIGEQKSWLIQDSSLPIILKGFISLQ
ncbi:hypothetical protein EUGRSUZ_D01250 [Eucalyptus grandis]|uniref:PGG domain-containing protein n=1 Tax=Eucalyptus grandis TaxID=71139 RepID=A0A059CG62_EUCGR|nr:hypothetical protein EUGRSUZ_D01250 [Eucalyptus grandis]